MESPVSLMSSWPLHGTCLHSPVIPPKGAITSMFRNSWPRTASCSRSLTIGLKTKPRLPLDGHVPDLCSQTQRIAATRATGHCVPGGGGQNSLLSSTALSWISICTPSTVCFFSVLHVLHSFLASPLRKLNFLHRLQIPSKVHGCIVRAHAGLRAQKQDLQQPHKPLSTALLRAVSYLKPDPMR